MDNSKKMTRDERMEWALTLMVEEENGRPKCERVWTEGAIGHCHLSYPDRTPDQWCRSCLAYFALRGSFPTLIFSETR
jgi:hypothetical protein